MRIALVHDWLVTRGGAERVFEAIEEVFPGERHALFASTDWEGVTTSYLQRIPKITQIYPWVLPLMPRAIESLDLREFDLVISSSWAVAKGVRTHSEQLHVCYCHTPMRYAWDLREAYLATLGRKRHIARPLLEQIRHWDQKTATRVDHWIANSNCVAERISRHYGVKQVRVIYPPVDTDQFLPALQKEDFYLTASRLVPYKQVDLIARAFKRLPGRRLVIIGDGQDRKKIEQLCGDNITYLGYRHDLANFMARAKAFVFAAEEDFGIAPLEAQSCGTPVIAYGKGGALETVVENETGIFFAHQTERSIEEAVREFETRHFNGEFIRQHALHFDKKRFQKELCAFINACIHTRWGNRDAPVAALTRKHAQAVPLSRR